MKTPARHLPLYALLVALLTTGVIAIAQEAPPPAPAAPATAEPEKTPVAPATDKTAAPAAPEATPAPAAETENATATAEKPAEPATNELRRLDVEAPKAESTAPAAPKPAVDKADKPVKHGPHRVNVGYTKHQGNERVTFGGDSSLAAGEHADAVVSIFGSSTSAGEVGDSVVSVLGSSTSSGKVANAVVSVLGSTTVSAGEVGDAAVSVLGDVELGPDAEAGEVVCVGGVVKRDAAAVVHGQVNNVGLGVSFGGFEWLHAWVTHCLFYGRPLAFAPHLMWAWWIAIGALALYTIIALLFPRGIDRCVQTLEERPGYSLLSALLVTLLTPLAAIVLIVTVVGTPALVLFLIVASFVGKATMLAWIGRRISRLLGARNALIAPAVAVLIGGLVVLLLYTIPVVGFVVAKLLSWLGVGVVVYTIIALLFPRGIDRCVQTLEQRPGYSLLTALLVTLLTPLAAIILVVTVVGTPALVLFLLIAGFFGKATMLAWIGRRISRLLGARNALIAPAIAVLIGGLLVLLLYTIPVVGFVVAKLLSWLGVGVVVYTIILAMKRDKPAPPAAQPVAATAMPTAAGAAPFANVEPVVGAEAVPPAAAPMQSAGFGAVSETAVPPVPPVAPGAPVPPVMPAVLRSTPVAASTLMRAGFWIRLAASVIDTVIVAIAVNLFPNRWEPSFLLSFGVYVCVLWALRGTTVGGIICNLKVVRVDDRPLDWPTALVRTLGGFVSLIAAGLGFIWVVFDDQKQSWHDKIAGTTVVIVPKGVSLV